MNYLRLLPLLILPACSPESPSTSSSTPQAPAANARATAVHFDKLGWAESKFTSEGKPFTGTAESNYKNSTQLKQRYQIKDGVYHGLVEEWYENGQQKTKTSYLSGKHEGDNFYWNPDGSLQVHKVWKNDQLISETPGQK